MSNRTRSHALILAVALAGCQPDDPSIGGGGGARDTGALSLGGGGGGSTGAAPAGDGAEIYRVFCASCHGADGGGTGSGPGVRGDAGGSEGALRSVILYGDDDMPDFGGVLTDAEVEALIDWMQETWG